MGLVLTFAEGEAIYFMQPPGFGSIGERKFVVEKVLADDCYLIRDTDTDDLFEIGPDRSVEVLPGVTVSAAKTFRSANLNIEAPREVKIERGRNRRGGKL